MPRIANHDARRADLIEVAATLIADSGMDGLTVRSVANAAGVSTGVVSHYFEDKRDLLQQTYDATAEDVYDRVAQTFTRDPGEMQALLEGFLPLDAQRLRGWRVWFAFWGLAIGDAELAKDQKQRARRALKLIGQILSAAVDAGHLPRNLDIDTSAALVNGSIQGIAAQTVFDPKEWPPARQTRVLAGLLRSLRTGT